MPLVETITLITTCIISIINAARHLHIYKKKKNKQKNKCVRRHSI